MFYIIETIIFTPSSVSIVSPAKGTVLVVCVWKPWCCNGFLTVLLNSYVLQNLSEYGSTSECLLRWLLWGESGILSTLEALSYFDRVVDEIVPDLLISPLSNIIITIIIT